MGISHAVSGVVRVSTGKRIAALAGTSVDSLSVGAQFSIIGKAGKLEDELHILAHKSDGIEIDRVAALIEAVKDSFVCAFIVLGDFDDGAKVLACVQRALPCISNIVRRRGRGLSGGGDAWAA